MTTPESQASATARAELYDTLGQLRSRLDYAQRIDDTVADMKQRLVRQRTQRPAVFASGVAGIASLAGLAVWGIARSVMRARD